MCTISTLCPNNLIINLENSGEMYTIIKQVMLFSFIQHKKNLPTQVHIDKVKWKDSVYLKSTGKHNDMGLLVNIRHV